MNTRGLEAFAPAGRPRFAFISDSRCKSRQWLMGFALRQPSYMIYGSDQRVFLVAQHVIEEKASAMAAIEIPSRITAPS
jgi:hypothetical protein